MARCRPDAVPLARAAVEKNPQKLNEITCFRPEKINDPAERIGGVIYGLGCLALASQFTTFVVVGRAGFEPT